MKILVTGVAGFIGSNLADRLLAEGHEVVGIDNLSYGVIEQVPDGVEFHKFDVRDNGIYPFFKGVDTVFHMAAKNCIADCQMNPVETASNNVIGLVNVFNVARLAGVRKVVYAESSAVYEGSTVMPTPESEYAPQSFYALSKAAGRLFAEGFNRYTGILTTGLRYFCVYGPRQDYRRTVPPVMSSFIIHMLRGTKPTIYGNGMKRRDFIYIDDVNDFHIRCINDARTDNDIYNLGSGINFSVNEIFYIIRSMLDSEIEPIFKPNIPGEAQETRADNSKAMSLGWWPKTNLEEGLQKSIDFIREKVIV